MITEIIVICIFVYATLGSYFSAKAELIREEAREKQLHNDKLEFDHEA
jgi:hypothetical protein